MEKKLPRGLPGMVEVPVLNELNDIRQSIASDTVSEAPGSWDLSVVTRDEFHQVADAVLGGRYKSEDIDAAYNQLHLIQEMGGSHAPIAELVPVQAQQGKNAGKSLVKWIPASEELRRRDDNLSRENTAIAFLEDWELLPVTTNAEYLRDTQAALEQEIASSKASGEKGDSLYQIANTGFRKNKHKDDPALAQAYTQNMNDRSNGFDRLTRDYIGNQLVEFGHYVPIEGGGADESFNGRMQAMSANKATREKQGVYGALRALGPSYQANKKFLSRFAGDVLAA